MSKKLISLFLSVVIIAFLGGYGLHYYVFERRPDSITDKKEHASPTIFVSNTDKNNELNEEARAEYRKLASEYLEYISGTDEEDRISFQEFLTLRKNTLVQEGKFSDEESGIDEKIREWQNKNLETDLYTISGVVNCDELKSRGGIVMVAVFVPSPIYSTLPEQPSAVTFTDCYKKEFDIDLELTSNSRSGSPSVSIIAFAFDGSRMVPKAIGTDQSINDIPLSVLTMRKENPELKITLYELRDKDLETEINVAGKAGEMLSLYGLDNVMKFMPDFKTFRTTVSGVDGVARIRALPMGSNIYFELLDVERPDNKVSLITQTSSNKMDIAIPSEAFSKKGTSVVIIPPVNIPEGDITILSRSFKNRTSKHFNNFNFRPIILSDVDTKDLVLDLRVKNKSLGLMPVLIKKDAVTIAEPAPKTIDRLFGRVTLDTGPCSDCTVSIKYTDQRTVTDASGKFCLNNINIIDSSMEVLIEPGDRSTIMVLPLHYSYKDLNLDLFIPGKKLVRSWNNILPTLPVNGLIFGDHPYYKGYHAFISGIDNNVNIEAAYLDDSTGLPVKNKFSTSSTPDKMGFGKFLFPDVSPGKYVLYLITSDKIIHSRLIRVESGTTTIVN